MFKVINKNTDIVYTVYNIHTYIDAAGVQVKEFLIFDELLDKFKYASTINFRPYTGNKLNEGLSKHD